MHSLIIKSLLIFFNFLQWLIVFLSVFAIIFPIHEAQIETSKYGIGHFWFLFTIFVLWRFFKRLSRHILLKLAIIFDKFYSTKFEFIFNKFLDSETTNLEKAKRKEEKEKKEMEESVNIFGSSVSGSDFDNEKEKWDDK